MKPALKDKKLSKAQKELIRLLAQAAARQYVEEEDAAQKKPLAAGNA